MTERRHVNSVGGYADRLTETHEQLTAAVEALTRDGQWARMLATAAKFPRYSASNVLLIMMEKPDATKVAGIRAWNSLGRRVIKGEKSIAIIAPCTYPTQRATRETQPTAEKPAAPAKQQVSAPPDAASREGTKAKELQGFRVVRVFDVSQTEGEPLPEESSPLRLAGAAPAGVWDALGALVVADGYTLQRDDCGTADGWTSYTNRTVRIRPDVEQAHATLTLAHEIGHIRAEHVLRAASPLPVSRGKRIRTVKLVVRSRSVAVEVRSRPMGRRPATGVRSGRHLVGQPLRHALSAPFVLQQLRRLRATRDEFAFPHAEGRRRGQLPRDRVSRASRGLTWLQRSGKPETCAGDRLCCFRRHSQRRDFTVIWMKHVSSGSFRCDDFRNLPDRASCAYGGGRTGRVVRKPPLVRGSGLAMSSSPGPLLPLSLMDRDRFLGLFYEPVTLGIQTKTAMHLHVLRIDGGDFALAPLYKELANNSVSYVLSRQNMGKLLSDPSRLMEFADKVKAQFKTPDPNAGEGGELLLYSFLEGHLGAPKILSKMELKTSAEHYIHGTDGVHLLRVGQDEYQLIFGESKMYGDATGQVGSSIKRGIKAAFASMAQVQQNAFEFDTWLVESELLKESLDEAKVKLLASILLPVASGKSSVTKHNAFGVFIGYELDVTTFPFGDHTTAEIEEHLWKLAQDTVAAEVDTIRKEVNDHGLGGHQFHMYAVPFLKRSVGGQVRGIEEVRGDLAARLSGKEAKK